MHGSGFGAFMRHDETQKPEVDRKLLGRVFAYARPYRTHLLIVLVTIIVITLMSLLPPLLMRQLIDVAIPEEDQLGTFDKSDWKTGQVAPGR